jgi:hypothetical protein
VACTGWDLSSVIREAGFNPQAVFLALAALLYLLCACVCDPLILYGGPLLGGQRS